MKNVIISKEAKPIKRFTCNMVEITSNENTQSITFYGIPGINKGEYTVTHSGSLHYDVDHINKRAFVILVNEPVRIDITW